MLQTIDHGPIRELRLDRPPANALDPGLIAALLEGVRGAPEDGVRALILSGRPGMFSAGLDVPHLLGLDRDAMAKTWADFYDLMKALATSPIPVAAAITGHSPAGGAVLALWCDRRIMAEGKFKIGLNEVQVGLPMPPAILRAVGWLVGQRQAARLCMEGLLLPAAEAREVGFVDDLAPVDEVVARAIAWCEGILALPPQAMALTRSAGRSGLSECLSGGTEEIDLVLDSWFSAETQGAMRALVESLKKA